MKFCLKPPLEQMVLGKIGISLWCKYGVSNSITYLGFRNLCPNLWKGIEKEVGENVRKLSLPQLLEDKVFGVIKPIGMQIYDWMKYYREYDEVDRRVSDDPANLLAAICWTPHHTIDRKKTAEVLVRDENLSISRRYRLACDYFLENDIVQLWHRLPKKLKDYDWDQFKVVAFWSNKMKTGGAGHISYKNLFYSSALEGNKVAAKYFLQKLTPQQKEDYLELLASHVNEALHVKEVLYSLLSEVEEEEQKKVFESKPNYVLECFLEWPFQSFFLGVANCMWDFLTKHTYCEILTSILMKVKGGFKDYNYQKLFGEFLLKSPSALKDSLIDEMSHSDVLQHLLGNKDKENMRLVLKDATRTAKLNLIYSIRVVYSISNCITSNGWDFLEFFIRECLSSKNEMLKFKEAFEKCMITCDAKVHIAKNKQQWNQLFCSSDDTICEFDKRTLEVGESSLSKRFKSLQ